MCIPSPAILHLVLAVRDEHFRLPAFYADEDDFMESLAAAYRKAIRAFYEQGCRYLQLDDTSWGTLCSPEERSRLEQRGIDPNKMELEPADSPWGEIQTCHTLCPGAYSVSTAGHGGVMVSRELADKVLCKEAKTCGFMERGYLCFEEDCAAPVALRELMDRGLYQAPVNEYFAPGEYEAVINDSLQTFHPEYWQAREKMRAEKARTPHSKTAKHKERER